MTCPSTTTSATALLTWRQEHELAVLRAEDPAGDEVPDRVLLKAVEYLEATWR